MKGLFEEPKFDVIFVDDVDIITTSGEVKPCCEIEELTESRESIINLNDYIQ